MDFLFPVIHVMHLQVLFFNPGPYAGYLSMVLPVCLHLYLRICGWKGMPVRYKIEKGAAAVAGMLILCVLPSTMSRSAWIAAAISCIWVHICIVTNGSGIYCGVAIKSVIYCGEPGYF